MTDTPPASWKMESHYPRHCSDETLLAHLDGELTARCEVEVRRHLQACWQCRLHLAELSEQILEVTRAVEKDTFPGVDRIADARQQFLTRTVQRPQPKLEVPRTVWLRRLSPVWIAGSLALAATTTWFWHAPAPRPERRTKTSVAAPGVTTPPAAVRTEAVLGPVTAPARAAKADPAALALLEVKVRYALHRAGLCMGEPIEVERTADGYIRVSGAAVNEDRRAVWLAALAPVVGDSRLRVDIVTVEQALKNAPQPVQDAVAEVGMPPAGEAPAQPFLEKELASHPDGAGAAAAARANQIVDGAELMLAHAWSLRRLAEQDAERRDTALNDEASRMIEQMIRDHRSGLRRQLTLLNSSAGPTLGALVGPSAADALESTEQASAADDSVAKIFERAHRLHTALLHLFTTAGAGTDPAALAHSALPEIRALRRTLGASSQDRIASETK